MSIMTLRLILREWNYFENIKIGGNCNSFKFSQNIRPVIGYNSEVEESSPVSPIESYLLFHALKSSDQKCKDVLLHPLVKMFLYLKWIRLRYLLYVSMTFHVFWLLAYTAFLLEVYLYYCPYSWPEEDGPG